MNMKTPQPEACGEAEAIETLKPLPIQDLLIVDRAAQACGKLDMRDFDYVIYVRKDSPAAAVIRDGFFGAMEPNPHRRQIS